MLQENDLYAVEPVEIKTNHFVPTARVQREFIIDVQNLHSKYRGNIESFILDKFQHRHSAIIREFMPLLIDLEYSDNKSAAVGIRPGFTRPFFLESYLEDPIEEVLCDLEGVSVDRESIVEIGNFAADNVRIGSLLFTILAKGLLEAGYEWMVFTATAEVEKMINKLGCKQTVLSEASESKVQLSPSDWGSYYETKPKVIVCNLHETISKAETNVRLNQIFVKQSKEITRLAISLKAINKGVFV